MTEEEREELLVLADWLEDEGHNGCELIRKLVDWMTPGDIVSVAVNGEFTYIDNVGNRPSLLMRLPEHKIDHSNYRG